jgi:serine/threonine protein kinase/tetratricopeptide (TPR) repeat protein
MATGAAHKICESCGATLHGESPAGLCPACLLTTAIEEGDLEEFISGSRIQDYELLNEVARGGMGIVYRARQRVPPRIVALKMILPANVGSADALKRFRAEAEAAASLEHEGILPIYAVGEHDGAPFYSMKFAEGGTLAGGVSEYRLKPREAAALIATVTRAVAFAHEHGILHRDLKPANVLFDGSGKPYVSDFGLAKWLARESDLTQTFAVLGTPFYMAPEQAISSHMVTASADVYSLGAILYHLLTGNPPFTGDTPMEVLHRAENQPVARPRLTNRSIPPDLETICLKCLEKDPKRRYPAAAGLAEDLERWLKHEPIRAKRSGFLTHARRWAQRNPTSALLTACLVVLAVASGWVVWKSELIHSPLTTGIAVLPFQNLGDQKEDSSFVDGVQDDILTKLAKIADLKVISRTSVMDYRGKRNVRQIGNDLRVSHVLEGSVRKAGTNLRLNAQLIDTRTDTHVWAEQYDRDLNDLFAVQAEIAQKVAEQVHAKLSVSEKASVEERPTQDLAAYDLYLRAVSMIYNAQVPFHEHLVNLSDAVELLDKAVARDANFFLAYCQLAFLHDLIYQQETDHTPSRLALSKSAIDSAFRLRPNSGEAHLALAWHVYWGYADYERARAELALAQQSLPNNARVYELAGLIDRRQGRWADATHNFERACELDPRNLPYLITLSTTYLWLRDYEQHTKIMDRIVALHPERRPGRIWRGCIEVDQRADTGPCHAVIEKILTDEPESGKDPFVLRRRLDLALYDRDLDAAGILAAALPEREGRDFWLGVVAWLKGDGAAARVAFMSAHAQLEEELRVHPDNINLLSGFGLIDATLGRKQEALSKGRRAIELAPVAPEAMTGWDNNEGFTRTQFAMICAWIGERELALEQLEALAKNPAGPGYGRLRLDPMWDPLRGDPRFEKIVVSLAPK